MIKQLLSLAIAATLLTACGSGTSTTPDAPTAAQAAPALGADTQASIDQYVAAQMARQHLPGMSIVVSRKGVVVMEKSYGLANVESNIPASARTVFRIGSITKQFTAAAVLMLQQDGKLDLDQRLTRHFPNGPASWNTITVRQLLQHTSGLPRDLDALASQYDPSRPYTLDERIALLGQIPLENTPGAVESYSNAGYYLLGLLIERVSGQSYFDFLQSRIFLPLGMRSAGLVTTTPPDMAAGYLWDDGKLLRADMLFATEEGGYGGLQMTASDLAKWDAALDTDQYLGKRSRDQMWSPAVLNDGSTASYGFGWELDSINQHPFVWHDGQVPGFHSQYERHASDGLSVIVLTNQTDGAPEKIAAAITAMVNPALDWQVVADPRPQVGALARGVVDDIVAGTFHAERYTAAAVADLNAGLYQAYVEAARGAGVVEQVGLVDSSSVGGAPTYRYRIKTRYDTAMMVFQLDASGKISLLRLI